MISDESINKVAQSPVVTQNDTVEEQKPARNTRVVKAAPQRQESPEYPESMLPATLKERRRMQEEGTN